MRPADKHRSSPARWRSVFQQTQWGWSLAAAVLIGFFGGRWLDGWLGTEPWFLVAGSLAGIAVGFYQLFTSLGKL